MLHKSKIIFDAAKDAANVAKHGVSLALADEMVIEAIRIDDRKDYGEPRWRAFGLVGSTFYCLVFTNRDGATRAISLRPAHAKEYRRYVP